MSITRTYTINPFGMLMTERSFSSESYRYGFNGQEKDDEIKGSGNSINYLARIYDTRLGKFLSVDPLTRSYPELSPYQFASNTPIWAIDLDGLEAWKTTSVWTKEKVAAFQKYVKPKIEQYQANNVEIDCADLAVRLLIGYAKDKGLPVSFTMVNGEVFNNESLEFNGYKINEGDVSSFETAAQYSTKASSLFNDMSAIESEKVGAGDLMNTLRHIYVILEIELNENNGYDKVTQTSGDLPAAVPRTQSFYNKPNDDGMKYLRWNVLKIPKVKKKIPSPIDGSLPGYDENILR
jgi:RHS repeat-associated protein